MKIKRRSIILAQAVFFFVLLVAIPGCGQLAEMNAEAGAGALAAGSPGSGSWNPSTPNNQNQCKSLYETEITLIDRFSSMEGTFRDAIRYCYDAEGNRIKDSDNPLCADSIHLVEKRLKNHAEDILVGYGIYNNSCTSISGAPELSLPPVLQAGAKDLEGGETSPALQCPPYCCLTCTLELDETYYAYNPYINGK